MSDFILDHPSWAVFLFVFVLATGIGWCAYYYETHTNDPVMKLLYWLFVATVLVLQITFTVMGASVISTGAIRS